MLGPRFRRNVFHHAPSVSSVSSLTSGNKSLISKRSDLLLRRSVASTGAGLEGIHQENRWLKLREWLVIVVEVCLTFTVYIVRERNNKVEELVRVGRTRRQNEIEMLYWEGWATLGSLFTGCIADSYIGHHTIALISVTAHFFVITIVLMEETIKGNQKGNPYASIVFNVVIASIIIIKSTDFTRLVFGLADMSNRKKVTIMHFIFLFTWVGERTVHGGLVVCMLSPFYGAQGTRLSFVASGISLFIFVYVISANERRQENLGLGCRVMQCFLLGTYYTMFRIKKKIKKSWLNNTDNKLDRVTIVKTKDLLVLYVILLPTIGFSLSTSQRPDVFHYDLFSKVMTNNAFVKTFGVAGTCYLFMLLASAITYFGVWPVLKYIGVKNTTTVKFLIGHVFACLAFFYCGSVSLRMSTFEFTQTSGFIRIFNTRAREVELIPQDKDFSNYQYTIQPGTGAMVAYPCSDDTLFAVTTRFSHGHKETTNYTMYLSVYPDVVTGFMVLDPPEIARIQGRLPIREGPPGTNEGSAPRIYLFNTARTLKNAVLRIKRASMKKVYKEITIKAGILEVFQIDEGSYDFSVSRADIRETFEFKFGGVYGILLYADTSTRAMSVDVVISGNEESIWLSLGYFFLDAVAVALGLVSLRYIVYTAAPVGLLSMSFAYLSALEHFSSWVGYVGFKTWHHFVTSQTVFTYAFAVTFCLFVCMFVLIKYKDVYNS